MNALQYIHQPDRVARKASDVLAADWRYQSREKASNFFHVCRYRPEVRPRSTSNEFPSRVIIGNCRLL